MKVLIDALAISNETHFKCKKCPRQPRYITNNLYDESCHINGCGGKMYYDVELGAMVCTKDDFHYYTYMNCPTCGTQIILKNSRYFVGWRKIFNDIEDLGDFGLKDWLLIFTIALGGITAPFLFIYLIFLMFR